MKTRAKAAGLPIVTISVLAVTGIVTALQFPFPAVLHALQRTPGVLRHNQWWRLITPLFVHADGWRQIAFNFPAILILGVIVEHLFTRRQWLVLYFVPGIIGELAGYAWQPNGAGASVAGAGLLGALAAWLWLNRTIQGRAGALFLMIGAVSLTFSRDIHGPPILAGFCIGFAMLKANAQVLGRPTKIP
jgi:rhomboid protease GluP